MKMGITSAMRMGAEGVRVMCGGRLGGAEIARSEQYKEGRIPLHTLRANIDYAQATAMTIYGTIALPLIVITGFYGMNFPELPLLHSGHGAALVVGAMTASTLGIMIYFRRRGWM